MAVASKKAPRSLHYADCASKSAMHHQLWSGFHKIQDIRNTHNHIPRTELGSILDKENAFLHYAPHRRLCELWGLSCAMGESVRKVGSWIYALWSPASLEIYVGQIGGRGSLNQLLQ